MTATSAEQQTDDPSAHDLPPLCRELMLAGRTQAPLLLLELATLPALAQLLKTGQVSDGDVQADGDGRGTVVGGAVKIAILHHQHPEMSTAERPQSEGLSQPVA